MKLLLDTNIFLEVVLAQQREQEVKILLSKIDEYEFFVTDFSIHSIGLLLFRRGQHQAFLGFLSDVFIEGGVPVVGLDIVDIKDVVYTSQHFAHDFQTLEDDTTVFYQMSEFYHPDCARGVRWNDPVFGIEWPLSGIIISEKDKSYSYWR